MSRPTLEVADIIRAVGTRFVERNRSHLAWPHLKVMRAIERCRTAALGGHRDWCTDCGYDLGLTYNSCRNRHCPKCQTHARNQWLAARTRDLVPVGYFHVVFTVPHQLSPLMLQNKRLLYNLLFRASAETLLEVAANPERLGAEIGFLSILHTWGQTLEHHPHIHCVVPAGGFGPGRASWVHPKYRHRFLVPVAVLSEVFRGKFVEALKGLFRRRKLRCGGSIAMLQRPFAFRRFVDGLYSQDWVVYAKKPFGGPEHVLQYLARYTHRVAISNHRLISFADGQVTFRWKDYKHGNKKRKMAVAADEFLRRFLLHVLPRGFVRIRHYGWLSCRNRSTLVALCRSLLAADVAIPTATPVRQPSCPRCGGRIAVAETFTPAQLLSRSTSPEHALDSS